MNSRVARLGSVVAVSGSAVEAVLDPVGPEMAPPQLGNLVKIRTRRSLCYGLVGSLAIHQPSSPPSPQDQRRMTVHLLGEVLENDQAAGFRRGVSVHPGLDDSLYPATAQDLAVVYARPQAASVEIGSLHQDPSIPAHILVDQLLAKHFAILGATGSGKSCAVAVLLRALLRACPFGHVVILDPHDEYSSLFGDEALRLSPEDLDLPYWLLTFEELTEVLCSQEVDRRENEAAALKEAVVAAKSLFQASGGERLPITVDTPVPFRLSALIEALNQAMGQLGKGTETTHYLRLLARIDELVRDRRYAFMFSGRLVDDAMASLLSRLLRMPVAGQPVAVVNLSGVPSEIVDVVVSLLTRLIFDFALWSPEESRLPVLLVCEEAHRYIPRDPTAGFAPTRRSIARIAKEGRKYGVALALVSQRPAELSQTILSQCSTLLAMRLTNGNDQEFVRRTLPDETAGLFASLPALRSQEALVVGEGVSLPVRVRLAELHLPAQRRNGAVSFATGWRQDTWSRVTAEAVVERWRRQSRR